MKISIVIPYYNAITTINRCLKSISKQTHKDIEVIIVDDYSDIPLKEEDLIIKCNIIRNNTNIGPSESRHVGIQATTGDYITTIDADDEYSHDKIFYRCIKEIEKHDADIVQFGLKTIKNNTVKGTNIMLYGVYTSLMDRHNSTANRGGCRFPNCYLVKSDLYKSIPFIPYRIQLYEDTNLAMKLVYLATKIVSIPYIGYTYHYTEGSMSSRSYEYGALDKLIYLLDFLLFLLNRKELFSIKCIQGCIKEIKDSSIIKSININTDLAKDKLNTIKNLREEIKNKDI